MNGETTFAEVEAHTRRRAQSGCGVRLAAAATTTPSSRSAPRRQTRRLCEEVVLLVK